MEVKTLYTLIAVADHGGFAAAGKALGLSVSAVSLQMRGLEDETGRTLFDRSRRPPELTAEGRALVDGARDVIASWERLSESLRRDDGGGMLRVGTVHTVVSGQLPAALRLLRQALPELSVHLTTALTHDLVAAVRHRKLDVAVVTEPARLPPELAFRPFREERLVVVAPPDAKGGTAAEILALNPVVRFGRQARVAEIIEAALGRLGIAPAYAMEIDTLDGVLSMVASGLGVSVVPEPFDPAHAAEGLRMLPLGDPPATRRLGTLVEIDHVRRRFADRLHEALLAANDAAR